MVEQGKKPRRRRKGEVDEQLAELLAKRDSLDADKAERDRIEQDALRRYAEARVQMAGIDSQTQQKVDELRQQIEQVQQRAREDRVAGETAQAEALATLNAEPVGRTADELARLFELPIKRVRKMIRSGKTAPTTATQGAKDTVASSPAATSTEAAAVSSSPAPADTPTSNTAEPTAASTPAAEPEKTTSAE